MLHTLSEKRLLIRLLQDTGNHARRHNSHPPRHRHRDTPEVPLDQDLSFLKKPLNHVEFVLIELTAKTLLNVSRRRHQRCWIFHGYLP